MSPWKHSLKGRTSVRHLLGIPRKVYRNYYEQSQRKLIALVCVPISIKGLMWTWRTWEHSLEGEPCQGLGSGEWASYTWKYSSRGWLPIWESDIMKVHQRRGAWARWMDCKVAALKQK